MTDPNSNPTDEPRFAQGEAPAAGAAPVPSWLWILAVVLVGWSALYLGMNSGGFESNIFNADQVSWAGGGGGPVAPPDPMVIGKRIYTANCVVCHQATGMGVAGQFPPLVGSEWVITGTDWHGDNHLAKILLNGMQGPVQVKGNTYNNAMPAWKQLKDSDIASVLTYIRNEWGNEAPAITADYIAATREEVGDRSEPWTQSALQAIPKTMISDAGASAPAADGEGEGEGAEAGDAAPEAEAAPTEAGESSDAA